MEELKNDIGVRTCDLTQELNRKMGLLTFLKGVQVKKLKPLYEYLLKKEQITILFENSECFMTNDVSEKHVKAHAATEGNDGLTDIFNYTANVLKQLNCQQTAYVNCFTVIQMFLVHVKMLKMKKKKKTKKEGPKQLVSVNPKNNLDVNSSKSDTDTDRSEYKTTDDDDYERKSDNDD